VNVTVAEAAPLIEYDLTVAASLREGEECLLNFVVEHQRRTPTSRFAFNHPDLLGL
jgi:hypothetical protein